MKKINRNVMVGITAVMAGMTMTGCSSAEGDMFRKQLIASIRKQSIQKQMEEQKTENVRNMQNAQNTAKPEPEELPAVEKRYEEELSAFDNEIVAGIIPRISGTGLDDAPIQCVYGPRPEPFPDAGTNTAPGEGTGNEGAENSPAQEPATDAPSGTGTGEETPAPQDGQEEHGEPAQQAPENGNPVESVTEAN